MRHSAFFVALIGLFSSQANAQAPGSIMGQVVEQNSFWAQAQSRLLTKSEIMTPNGARVVVTMYGGVKDGLRMQSPDLPTVPTVGDHVSATVYKSPLGTNDYFVKELNVLDVPQSEQLNYVQTTNITTAVPTAWTSGCAQITYHPMGTSHIQGTEEFDVLDDVLERWRQDTEECSYFELVPLGVGNHSPGIDGINLIRFYDNTTDSPWCPAGTTTQSNGMPCFPNAAAAITTVTSEDSTGKIVDADIEINGVTFSISNNGETMDPNPGCLSDLANAMTHEFGHLMGLDHTCAPSAASRPLDHNGQAVPLCSATNSEDVLQTTMYASQTCGETQKATPEADDILGICEIYPNTQPAPVCAPALTEGDCCSVAGPTPTRSKRSRSNIIMGLMLLLVFVGLRQTTKAHT